MVRNARLLIALLVAAPLLGFAALLAWHAEAAAPEPDAAKPIRATMVKVAPLHEKMGKPQPGDWLLSHKEDGQSFAEWLRSSPVMPRGTRKVLYVQPLGKFDKAQRKIVDQTADFLGRYYGIAVKVQPDLGDDAVPKKARRQHPITGEHQILTTYVLDTVLKPRLPADAAAYIAFTSSDLWPGEGWNFVFGQASLRDRVGVWSIARNGDPHGGDDEQRVCLLRTLKTAAHETGHMFSMHHCTAYECNMCGSNNRDEADRRPVEVCPECLGKLCYASGVKPGDRFRRLQEFCSEHGLKDEQRLYERLLAALEK